MSENNTSSSYEPAQFVPSGEYRQTGTGGLTPSGTASTNWPNYQPIRPVHCPTCRCGCAYYGPYYTPYDPYYTPWNTPWVLYTNR